jgi:hypothetical protein
MLNQATKRIIDLRKRAEQKKKQIEDSIKRLEQKKDRDERELRVDEMMAIDQAQKLYGDSATHLKVIYDEKKTVNDDKNAINELRKNLAATEEKIREINHWTSLSEHDDPDDQKEALSLAQKSFNSL